jgi:ABC-2 type transport system permease protein/lipopolysaccharide transport system permease protein
MDVRTSAPVPPHTEFFPTPRRDRGPSRWLASLRQERDELIRFWPVVQNMVVQELRVRYQRSWLGFLWTLLHPILMMTTLTLVFSQLFKKASAGSYAVYLFAGMVPWGFLAAALNDCAFSIIANEGLIRKIYLPKLVFPLSKVLVNLSTSLLSLGALFLLLEPMGTRFTPALLFLPVAVALFTAFVLGLGLIVAVANTFFRDCGHLVTVFLQAWYFATPIIYEIDLIPAEARWRFWLNPAYPFIQMFQEIIRDGHWPQLTTIVVSAGIAAVSLGIGYAAFKSYENKLVFRL